MFALVKPILSSVDLAICHLETPIAPAGEELSTFPFFGVPVEITDALAYAGFDRCSTASNHAMDRGARGIDATLNALDRVGISHTGMARTPPEINPKLILVNGISIAHMSYTFSYNGLPAANGETWRSALINTDRILRDVRLARKLGAQVVLLSMHWGNERESTPSSYQTQIADAITKSGEVDLIIGSHAHVLQPIKLVNDTFVIYGLGNFLSDMPTNPKDPPWPASTQDGAIVSTKITVAADGKVSVTKPVVTPTWVDRDSGWQIRSVVSDITNNLISGATRAELQASLKRTTMVLGEYIRQLALTICARYPHSISAHVFALDIIYECQISLINITKPSVRDGRQFQTGQLNLLALNFGTQWVTHSKLTANQSCGVITM